MGVTDPVSQAVDEVEHLVAKPRLRGVLHQYACAAVLSAGAILVIEAQTPKAKLASLVYVGAAVLQFAISAIYHTGTWGPAAEKILRRLDHSAIFCLIAGTYTPLMLVPFAHTEFAGRLLIRVWLGAVAGIGKTWLWSNAPRPFTALIYVIMGWSAGPYLSQLVDAVGLGVVVLVAAGGILYTIGALVYSRRWPDPYPKWYGYHEIFHTLVVLASVCHFIALYKVVVKGEYHMLDQ